mgnify:CR=1 FL=1
MSIVGGGIGAPAKNRQPTSPQLGHTQPSNPSKPTSVTFPDRSVTIPESAVPFPDRPRLAVTIPWGDLSTAYRSTGIPNIETYIAMPPARVTALRWAGALLPLAGLLPLQRVAGPWVRNAVAGPSAEERARERSLLWGRVEDGEGRSVEGTVETLEGYSLTAETAALAGERVDAVLVGGIGAGALTKLRGAGIRVFRATAPTASACLDAFLRNEIEEIDPAGACAGHGHDHGRHGAGHAPGLPRRS